MNISLTPELENFITEKVGSGMYSSVSEVIRDSLRLLREKDYQSRFTQLNHQIEAGLTSLDNGKHSTSAEVLRRLKKKSISFKKAK